MLKCPYSDTYLKNKSKGNVGKNGSCTCASCKKSGRKYAVGTLEEVAAVAAGIKPVALMNFTAAQREGSIPSGYDRAAYNKILKFSIQEGVKYIYCKNSLSTIFFKPENENRALLLADIVFNKHRNSHWDSAVIGYLLGYTYANICKFLKLSSRAVAYKKYEKYYEKQVKAITEINKKNKSNFPPPVKQTPDEIMCKESFLLLIDKIDKKHTTLKKINKDPKYKLLIGTIKIKN